MAHSKNKKSRIFATTMKLSGFIHLALLATATNEGSATQHASHNPRQLATGDYTDARSLRTQLSSFVTDSQACSDHLDEIIEPMEGAQDFVQFFINVTTIAEDLDDTLGDLKSTADKIIKMLRVVPKVGPVLEKVVNTVMKVRPFVKKMYKPKPKLEDVDEWIGTQIGKVAEVKGVVQWARDQGDTAASVLLNAIEHSSQNSNCGIDAIHDFVQFVDAETSVFSWILDGSGLALQTCSIVGDAINTLNLPSVDRDLDISIIERINALVGKVTNYINRVVEEAKKKFDKFICCTDVGVASATVLEVFSDSVNLATCWADAGIEGILGESMDVLIPLLQDVVGDINDPLERINDFVGKLVDLFNVPLPLVNLLQSDTVSFDEDRCDFSYEGATELVGELMDSGVDAFTELVGIEFEADGSFDLAAIGKQILSQCEDAASEIAKNDAGECCDFVLEELYAEGMPRQGWPNTHNCDFGFECKSGLCLGNIVCAARPFPDGVPCVSNNLCQSGKCHFLSCTSGKNGQSCLNDATCESGRCVDLTRTCADKKNDKALCVANKECKSGHCQWGQCTSGDNGETCNKDSFCKSGRCVDTTRICANKKNDRSACLANKECKSGYCEWGQCTSGDNGETCNKDSFCKSGRCVDTTRKCASKKNDRSGCVSGKECKSGHCQWGQCTSGDNGETCNKDSFCKSGRCVDTTRKCAAKKSRGKGCISGKECQSGRCKWLKCK